MWPTHSQTIPLSEMGSANYQKCGVFLGNQIPKLVSRNVLNSNSSLALSVTKAAQQVGNKRGRRIPNVCHLVTVIIAYSFLSLVDRPVKVWYLQLYLSLLAIPTLLDLRFQVSQPMGLTRMVVFSWG